LSSEFDNLRKTNAFLIYQSLAKFFIIAGIARDGRIFVCSRISEVLRVIQLRLSQSSTKKEDSEIRDKNENYVSAKAPLRAYILYTISVIFICILRELFVQFPVTPVNVTLLYFDKMRNVHISQASQPTLSSFAGRLHILPIMKEIKREYSSYEL